MKILIIAVAVALALLVAAPEAPAAEGKHQKFVTKYEGTESCTRCHKNTAKDVAESLHYQQLAVPQFLEGWEKGKAAGMMNTY
jgi:hypothetical protein